MAAAPRCGPTLRRTLPVGRAGTCGRKGNTDGASHQSWSLLLPCPEGARRRPAVHLPAPARLGRAGLDPAARLPGRDPGRVGDGPVAAGPHRQEPPPAAGRLRRPVPGRPARLGREGPGRAGHHVDAAPAPDAQHHGRAGPLGRPGAPLHAPGLRRPGRRVAQPPAVDPRQPARGRHVGGRGPDPPLPHQGAGRAAADLPPVLRPLHPHGPGRQLHPPGGQVQVRGQAAHPARADPRLPAPHPERPRRGRLRRRRGQPAHPGAGAVRLGPARHRQHPRHPPGLQGPDGPARSTSSRTRSWPACPASPPRPTSAGSTWPCTPT